MRLKLVPIPLIFVTNKITITFFSNESYIIVYDKLRYLHYNSNSCVTDNSLLRSNRTIKTIIHVPREIESPIHPEQPLVEPENQRLDVVLKFNLFRSLFLIRGKGGKKKTRGWKRRKTFQIQAVRLINRMRR